MNLTGMIKKHWPIILPAALVTAGLLLFSWTRPAVAQKNGAFGASRFAVVELFTSEGCSSCPAADKAVAELLHDYPNDVYVLGFHVDYWNQLGWKDEFSSADYSRRQQNYASSLGLSSIYTPQVIVDGVTEFTGSDKKKLYSTITNELGKARSASVTVSASAGSGSAVRVVCQTAAPAGSTTCIALLQSNAVTSVRRGENSGRQLHHVNVVRQFIVLKPGATTAELVIPAGLKAGDCRVVAFVQDDSKHITGAADCSLSQ